VWVGNASEEADVLAILVFDAEPGDRQRLLHPMAAIGTSGQGGQRITIFFDYSWNPLDRCTQPA
jgi:hypothetical protein